MTAQALQEKSAAQLVKFTYHWILGRKKFLAYGYLKKKLSNACFKDCENRERNPIGSLLL
jgi:hypothetical protein